MDNHPGAMPAEVRHYFENHQVLSLATQGPEGLWAAAVFYVLQDWHLYFLSAEHTRHARNFATEPHVAGTIQEDYRDWKRIQGIQLAGEVALLAGTARDEAIALYMKKFPFTRGANTELQKALAAVNWYSLRLTKLYFIDNSKGFGHRDEIIIPE